MKLTIAPLLLFLPTFLQAHGSNPFTVITEEMVLGELAQSLDEDQHEKLFFDFQHTERFNWKYIPASREGLVLKDLNEEQVDLIHLFLKSMLSEVGYSKTHDIIELEEVLRQLEGSSWRDRELYYLSVFGEPIDGGTWAWRFEGHHLSLNFTCVDGEWISATPKFFGANPAKVAHGSLEGLRVLAMEEDLGRAFVKSLSEVQRDEAIVSTRAYRDILTRADSKVEPLEDKGVSWDSLTEAQKTDLKRLIDVYLNSLKGELYLLKRNQVYSELDSLKFAWAGGLESGEGHYYRIQGQTFLIEYDNVQNGANHVHCVWREFDGDFGRDVLREHYLKDHLE